jgi:hypothetical protein
MQYTEELIRSTLAYGRLVNQGLFAFNLRGSYARPEDDWSIQFTILSPMERSEAKRLAEVYLKDAHKASGILFYQRSSDNDNQFRAFFHRGDM